MKPVRIFSQRAGGLIRGALALCLALTLATPGSAQDDDSSRKTKQTVAMSQKVYEKLTAVQEMMEAKDYRGGHAAIRELLQEKHLTPYETAQIYNLTGYAHYLEENYPEAIKAYEKVLAQPELPEALQQSTLKTLAQLHFTVEDYDKALDTVKRLMAIVPEPSADIYMLLGQALFQKGDYKGALEPIVTAIDMYKAQGRVPSENWLLLLRVCYYELGNFPKMIDVLKELIQFYPKDTYVLTLAGVYSELGDTKKQLALVEVLYEKGYLDNPTHIVNLANLYLLHEAPYKAAVVLERELEKQRVEPDVRNLRLLSQAWYTAREDEKAIVPLQKAAALSRDGELYVRLAQSYINLEKWSLATDAIETGLKLGGVEREDTANILLGMALFNQKKLSLARRAFEQASKDNRSRRAAVQWMAYVDSELRRMELMDQDMPQAQPREVDEMLKSGG